MKIAREPSSPLGRPHVTSRVMRTSTSSDADALGRELRLDVTSDFPVNPVAILFQTRTLAWPPLAGM
jgi:hypothetical protein